MIKADSLVLVRELYEHVDTYKQISGSEGRPDNGGGKVVRLNLESGQRCQHVLIADHGSSFKDQVHALAGLF